MKILESLRGELEMLWKLIACSLVLWPGKAQQMQFSLFASYRRNIWQGIKTLDGFCGFGEGLWQGSPGSGLVGFEMFGCRWMDSVGDKGHVWGCYNDGEGKWERKQGLQCQSGSASGLSPLLFIIVLEALSREFREGLPMELLYADDLVLVAETEELLIEKLRKWKKGMELKGLRVNISKTKVMRCQVGIGKAEESGKYPCGVCKQGIGDNSIKCVACHRWVHKMCSGISGRLGYVADFHCRRCLDGDSAQVVLSSEVESEPGVKVECVYKLLFGWYTRFWWGCSGSG